MKCRRLCAVFCLSGVMLACGQKGPLVLPDAPKHKRLAPKPTPAPSPAPAGVGTAASPGPAAEPPTHPPSPPQQ